MLQKQASAAIVCLTVCAISASPTSANPVSASITAQKTHQSESLSANLSSMFTVGPGIMKGAILLSESPGSGIDFSSVTLSYQGLLGQNPSASWTYNLEYELDTFVAAGLTSETFSGALGYQWVTESGFSSALNLSYANKENLHGQKHETKSLSVSTSKSIGDWDVSFSAAYGINDSSAVSLDRYISGSVSVGRPLSAKTYLSLSASQTNDHQRQFFNDAPFDIWMQSRNLGLNITHQFSPNIRASMNLSRSNNTTDYFGHLIKQNETRWSISTTYQF